MGTTADRRVNLVSHARPSTQIAEASHGIGRHVSNKGIEVVHPSDMGLPNEAYGTALSVMHALCMLHAAATATHDSTRAHIIVEQSRGPKQRQARYREKQKQFVVFDRHIDE
jgi:hypothetical protein